MAEPQSDAWARGFRWIRCDLREVDHREAKDFRSMPPKVRTASLRDALRNDADRYRLGCFAVQLNGGGTKPTDVHGVSCDEPHNLEYAGVVVKPASDAYDALTAAFYEGCRSVVAKYIAVPERFVKYDRMLVAEEGQRIVRRVARCFLVFPDARVTGRAEGVGNRLFR